MILSSTYSGILRSIPLTEDYVDYTIRKAEPRDLAVIAEIWLQGQPPNQPTISQIELEDYYAQFVGRDDNFGIWLARDPETNEVAGWQALLPCHPHPVLSRQWAFSSTYVAMKFRNKGAGTQLFEDITKKAPGLGFRYLMGFIRDSKKTAMAEIAGKAGWQRTCQLQETLPDGTTNPLNVYIFTIPNPTPTE